MRFLQIFARNGRKDMKQWYFKIINTKASEYESKVHTKTSYKRQSFQRTRLKIRRKQPSTAKDHGFRTFG